MMKVISFGSAVLVVLALLVVDAFDAQICPSNESKSSTVSLDIYQYLLWPRYGPVFEVYDNQQHRWFLRLAGGDEYGYSRTLELQNYQGVRTAAFDTTLHDSWTGNSYEFYATGTFPPLGFRVSPDFKWTTFYDVVMNGTSDDGSLKFNVSISYADFWTDSPANDLFSSKSITTQGYPPSCITEYFTSTGNNYIQTKGFWIAFDFDDGSHLYFNIPPIAGALAFVDQRSYSTVQSCN